MKYSRMNAIIHDLKKKTANYSTDRWYLNLAFALEESSVAVINTEIKSNHLK